MPKPKNADATRRTGTGGYRLSNKPVSTEADRTRLIRECLRDLAGVELIYAIRCPDGIIKIGHTADLRNRRRHFDTTPEAILAVKPGAHADEQAIHQQLRSSVARGVEYYRPTEQVMAVVNAMRTELGAEPVAA